MIPPDFRGTSHFMADSAALKVKINGRFHTEIIFMRMNTHCYTMVPGDASLVMVIQHRTHHKFMLFASYCENSKSPSTHTPKREVRNPGNSVVLT